MNSVVLHTVNHICFSIPLATQMSSHPTSEVRVTLLSYNAGCLQIHLLMNLQAECASIYIRLQCSYARTTLEFHWPLAQPLS